MRMGEAPLRVTGQKIWGLLKPYLYWVRYTRGVQEVLRHRNRKCAKRRKYAATLGKSISRHLRASGTNDVEFVTRAQARACRALAGQITCLGYGLTPIPSGERWFLDTFHHYAWPDKYFARIDYVAKDKFCDVKVPWELSRLQYLIWLAEGFVFDEGKSVDYLDRFSAIVSDWLRYNPTAHGVNWACPMEVAIRAINLFLAYSIFAEHLDETLSNKILDSLDGHSRFIERFPEISDVPGNHYLADLAGCVFPRSVSPSFGGAEFSRGVDAFTAEARRQFEPDGCHLERAPIYHRLCLEMVAVVLAMATRFRHVAVADLTDIVARGVTFCNALGTPGGKLPIFGDCDSGHVLNFGANAREFKGLQEFASGLTSTPLPVTDDLAHWLFALAGMSPITTREYSDEKVESIYTADHSGFLSARWGDLMAVMRVGAQGLLGRAPHDHDDALSIWVTKGELDLIVEEGCHSYSLNSAVRLRNISSTAHNVVQPSGQTRFTGNQGSIVKTMRGAPTASVWNHFINDGIAHLEANLETPSRASQPFEYCRRSVQMDSGIRMTVYDEWSWKGTRAAELRWHFGEGLKCEIRGTGVIIADSEGRQVMGLTFGSDFAADLSAFAYDYSPVYGSTVPCWGVLLSVREHKSCAVRSRFEIVEWDRSNA